MALLKSYRGKTPRIGKDCYVAEDAVITGDVTIGEGSSVWFGAVVRGDAGAIRIGKSSNVQDGAVLHAPSGRSSVEIGDEVTIGHRAIVHGATIGDRCLIGMNATILDNAKVGEGSIVGAGAVVLANTEIEPYTLYAGTPAKFIKKLDAERIRQSHHEQAQHYAECAREYLEENGKTSTEQTGKTNDGQR